MTERPPITFVVEAAQIMLFARAIGDESPEFNDFAAPEALVAPPTFVEVLQHYIPDYHVRPKPGKPWFGSGAMPTGVPARQTGTTTMHAEQHFEYHRPIRPGDRLVATSRPGKVWEKSGRSGAMHFSELITEFRDDQGRLVVTSIQVEVVITPVAQASDANG
jgi:hypothetical protein